MNSVISNSQLREGKRAREKERQDEIERQLTYKTQ